MKCSGHIVCNLWIQKRRFFLWRSGVFNVFDLPSLQKMFWEHFHDYKPFADRRQDLQQWAVKKTAPISTHCWLLWNLFEITRRCRNLLKRDRQQLPQCLQEILVYRLIPRRGGCSVARINNRWTALAVSRTSDSENKSVCDGVQYAFLYVFDFKRFWAHFHDLWVLNQRVCCEDETHCNTRN